MHTLRVVVEEIRGFCDLPMRPGDFFIVEGGRIHIPEGKYMCMWALQSMMPLLPLKQRNLVDENDWVPHTHRICCPDPNGQVIYRIEHADLRGAEEIPKRLITRPDICSGCRACELACAFHHTRAFSPDLARVWVEKDEPSGRDSPHTCHQCGTARCVESCPTGALGRHPVTRALTFDSSKCTACGVCIAACDGSLRQSPIDGHPLVCDLCGGEPECARRCPTGAITFGRGGSMHEEAVKT